MGKSKALGPQSFSETLVFEWLGRLKGKTTMVLPVLRPSSSVNQLKSVKEIDNELKREEYKECDEVLNVLVEVHGACAARHPLQRAICSVLLKLPSQLHGSVVDMIAANVACAVEKQVDEKMLGIMYIGALLENFSLGEEGLRKKLPSVLEFCLKSLDHMSSVSLNTGPVVYAMVEGLKITMSLLHKFSTVFWLVLLQESDWPSGDGKVEGREEWVKEKLVGLSSICEDFLTREDSSHDVVLAASMLLVVVGSTVHASPSPLLAGHLSTSVNLWLGLVERRPSSMLCLLHALLAKLSPRSLTGIIFKDEPLFLAMFSMLCQLYDSFTESNEKCVGACTLTLWSTVAREYLVKGGGSPQVTEALSPGGKVLVTLLNYVWSLWEDPLDGVRHQCKVIFENIIFLYQHLAPDEISSLAEKLLSLDSPTRSKFVFLLTLCVHVRVQNLLVRSPGLPAELLSVMGHQSLACHAGDLWSKLVALHWQEISGSESSAAAACWAKTWVLPLLRSMCTSSLLARRHITQHCLASLFRCTNVMEYVTDKLPEIESSPECRVATHLACLHCAKTECRDFAVSSESFGAIFKSSMHHAEEQVRLFALAMVCECVKTTDAPPTSQLRLLLDFVEVNGNSQSAGFRYPVLTSIKKVLCRVRDSVYVLCKAWRKNRGPDPGKIMEEYREFLDDLMKQQFGHLHPLSSYQRRNFSLSILLLVATIFPLPRSEGTSPNPQSPGGMSAITSPEPIPSLFVFAEGVSESQASCLLQGLRDPYDANRSVCLGLLQGLSVSKLRLSEFGVLEQLVKGYLSLVSQPKSVSCSSAACLLKLFLVHCNQSFNQHLYRLALPIDASLLHEDLHPDWQHRITTLELLSRLLNNHASCAREDLVVASMKAPMYGVVQSMRSVLEHGLSQQDCPDFKQHSCDIVHRIVVQCRELSETVTSVVCSSSPEGFFPDSKSFPEPGGVDGGGCGGNAQSLLLCCWHTMKEVSLLLGILVENFSEPSSAGDESLPVLGADQVGIIAGIFTHQLTEARHRGAFEMAYTGFSKLCSALWQSSDVTRSRMPRGWIQELLDSLQSSSVAKLLTVTRRSAGLPFFVQGILSSESSMSGRPCLKMAMKVLLEVAREAVPDKLCLSPSSSSVASQSASSEEEPVVANQPAAVHALNILRALFRDSRLGEHVVPFISEAVKIAISGFGAALWPVRNSSNLLFTSLVLRIFGAKRVLDEHSMENKTTAREFFTRFPDLYNYLLHHLQLIIETLEADRTRGSLQPSLLPLLLLLSRLYPSPLDEANSPTSLAPFVPLLIRCTSCSVWKTRVLASRAVSLMLTEGNCWEVLSATYDSMEVGDQNKLHGFLLMVSRSLQDRRKLLLGASNGSRQSVLCGLMELHLSCFGSIGTRLNPCPVTRALYLEVLLLFLGFQAAVAHLRRNTTLLPSLSGLTIAALQPATGGLLTCEEVYVKEMEVLLLVSIHFPESFKPKAADKVFKNAARNLDSELVQMYAVKHMKLLRECDDDDALSSGPLVDLLQELALLPCSCPDLLIGVYEQLCSHLDHLKPDKLNQITSQADHFLHQKCCRIELRQVLVRFMTSSVQVLHNRSSDCSQYLQGLLASYEEWAVPTQPDQLRAAIASSLMDLWLLVVPGSCEGKTALLMSHCRLVVRLLQDPDEDVRTAMANAVAKFLQDAKCCDFDSLNPSSSLKFFILLLPKFLPSGQSAFVVLMSFLDRLPPAGGPNTCAASPLFDEDPVNDYEEETVQMTHAVEALARLFSEDKDLATASKKELQKYIVRCAETEEPEEQVASWWERTTRCSHQTRNLRIQALLDTMP